MIFYRRCYSLHHSILALLAIAFSFLLTNGCNNADESTASPDGGPGLTDGDKRMQRVLAMVAKQINHPANGFAGEAKLDYLENLIANNKDPNALPELLTKKGGIFLEIGRDSEAVKVFENLVERFKNDAEKRRSALSSLGMAYMRLGERMNCINNHAEGACIMPIQGGGIHDYKEPARKATEAFESALEMKPDDLDARWLLNIAYMTLGEYPSKVPKRWLIPGLDKPGSTAVKPFTDIAADLDLNVKNRGGGAIVDDFNNDGFLDIVSSSWGLDDPLHFFINNGDGTFQDASKSSGLAAFMGGINLLQTDYNNDGLIDIFVLRGAWQGVAGFGEQPNSLLRNNGDGTFHDVTYEAKLLSFCPTQTATWNDFNRDGWLDLFIGNETIPTQKKYPCELYINNQDGTFTNIVTPDNLNIAAFVKGVTSGDYDNDGWPDIFLSCLSGEKFLLHNKGVAGKVPQFEEVGKKAGFAAAHTFPTFFFDFDNDGWLDIFICNYNFDRSLSYYAAKEALKPSSDEDGKMYLYHNNHDGTFTNVAPHMHVNQIIFSMGLNFGDIDNDGWLDMYMSTGNPSYQSLIPNRLYKNMGGKDFEDVTIAARVGNLQKGHGVAFADINNNGDQDLYVDLGGAYRGDAYFSSFLLNPGQNENNWINIKLEGKKTNRAAIGARVTLKFHENGVERLVYRDVNSGGSFGCSPFRRELGIGQATLIDEISIFWPVSGTTQVFRNVQPNQFLKIEEGASDYQVLPFKPLVFKRSDGSIPMCAPPRFAQNK